MSRSIDIDKIWWRNVQPGEFYNIERHHQIPGGGGSLYIEVPSSIVPATLDFLDMSGQNVDALPVIRIEAGSIGHPSESGPIEFRRKTGGRMRIASQNRQQPNSQRHPAWSTLRGFPSAPDDVRSKEEALPFFPHGGLRIYIAKDFDGSYFAGFNKGPRPSEMLRSDVTWEMYGTSVGGVIYGSGAV